MTQRLTERPWGHFEELAAGDSFKVKRICVIAGGKLSLQYHHHRAEHWTVVRGTALATRGDEQLHLAVGDCLHIPAQTRHRLENPGAEDIELIEVQTGDYLGEDDIVRLEDIYGRAGNK